MKPTNRSSRQVVTLAVLSSIMISIGIWQGDGSTAMAQSTGAFGGALIELVPDGGTVSSLLAASPTGPFYLQGRVFLNRTFLNCTPPANSESFVNFGPDGSGRRVGTWRMWGHKTGETVPSGAAAGRNNVSGVQTAVVNVSIDLDSFNGTVQLQGTLGRVFGAIESAGHPLADVLAITGGTGTFRSASGDAILTLLADSTGATCSNGGFQVALQENPRPPRFGNIIR